MKEKIDLVNQSIGEKKEQLKKKADDDFGKMALCIDDLNIKEECSVSDIRTPWVPKTLFIGSVLSAGGAVISKLISLNKRNKTQNVNKVDKLDNLFKILTFTGITLAGSGFVCSRLNKSKSLSPALAELPDLMSIKNEVVSKGIASVKKITGEWDKFMENNQKEIFKAIDSSHLNERKKDELSSKIFSYEVIDINLSDLMSMINKTCSLPEINENLEEFKEKLISAIETASHKQIAKYNSLLEV